MGQLRINKRRIAEDVVSEFATLPYVHGVCLFGSVARGAWSEWSDIDLLVVGAEDQLRPTRLLAALPDRLRNERISISCYAAEQVRELADNGSSFIDHVRLEGQILYDPHGTLTNLLSKDFAPCPINVATELEAELECLSLYEDLSIYRRNLLFPLARLYSIGKSIVILGVLASGQRVYEREAAFDLLKTLRPELSADIDVVARLRPFYRLVTRRGDERLPFSYRDAEQEVQSAVQAARRLGASVAKE